ncbi:hypothetical protein Pmani_039115 [Petrolisthes manimaculis]|uniref:Uncharacterized protein n=1 Tax=Petrolisthes manimaculis TaxID=1843537 RepID=A0AAE1TJV8_9EUCA|nr:hypothetical protein Pmani_039115 [Petrolisthes manimaculis]
MMKVKRCLQKKSTETVMEGLAALHEKVKEVKGGVKTRKSYQYLINLLEKDPSLINLVQLADFQAIMILLQYDTPGNWKVLVPVIALILDERPSLIHEILPPDRLYLAEEATHSLLINQSPNHWYDLFILNLFVVHPSLEQVIAVVNRVRFIIKDATNSGWEKKDIVMEGVVALEMLNTWRSTLVNLPNWQECLQRWIIYFVKLTPASFPLLEPALTLVLDLLKEGINVNITKLVLMLEWVVNWLRIGWSNPCQNQRKVYLTGGTNILASIIQVLPHTLTSNQRQGLFRQFFMLLEKKLPAETLKIVVNCTCCILKKAEPRDLKWVVDKFPAVTSLAEQVFDSVPGQPASETLMIKGQIITELLRVLSPFSHYLLTLCVRYLAGHGPHPCLALVSSWVCSILQSGAYMETIMVKVVDDDGKLVSFLDRQLDHFRKHRDPLYLQSLSQTFSKLRLAEIQPTSTVSEVISALEYKENDTSTTKGVCIMLPCYLSQTIQPPKLTAELVDHIHQVLKTARSTYHPSFKQILATAANTIVPTLPSSSFHSSSVSLTPSPSVSLTPSPSVCSLSTSASLPTNFPSSSNRLLRSCSSYSLPVNPYQPTTITVPEKKKNKKNKCAS